MAIIRLVVKNVYVIINNVAEHKVPQDVETDDKILGPFSFHEFVYLLIAAGAGFLAFALGRIMLPLAIIPIPVCIFFVAIALPLRKEQPTEIYLAAVIKYLTKPHVRAWIADGEEPLVEISKPVSKEDSTVKELSSDEVSRRLSFLSNLSDTQGWSTRGYTSAPANNTNLTDEFAVDAMNAEDVMEDSKVSDSFDNMLAKSQKEARERAINEMNNAISRQQDAEEKLRNSHIDSLPADTLIMQTSANGGQIANSTISYAATGQPMQPPAQPPMAPNYYYDQPVQSKPMMGGGNQQPNIMTQPAQLSQPNYYQPTQPMSGEPYYQPSQINQVDQGQDYGYYDQYNQSVTPNYDVPYQNQLNNLPQQDMIIPAAQPSQPKNDNREASQPSVPLAQHYQEMPAEAEEVSFDEEEEDNGPSINTRIEHEEPELAPFNETVHSSKRRRRQSSAADKSEPAIIDDDNNKQKHRKQKHNDNDDGLIDIKLH